MKRIHALGLALALGLAGLTYTYAQGTTTAEKSCCADCCCCKKADNSEKTGAMCPMKK